MLFFKKIDNLETRHRNQMEEAQRRYDQLKAERDRMERILKEVLKDLHFAEVL